MPEFSQPTRPVKVQDGNGARSHAGCEQTAHLAYRAQLLQRTTRRRQGRLGQWAFSLLPWALAGYGFRIQRILYTCVLTQNARADALN